MNYWRLTWLMLWRDVRAGEVNLLISALLIAISSSTAISLCTDRLQQSFQSNAAELIAADLAINSSSPVAPAWLEYAQSHALNTAQATEFSSVLMEHEELLLTSVKAVSQHYPLKGALKTSAYNQDMSQHQGPLPGMAWVDQRVLSALTLSLGESITIGDKAFILEKILTNEPDRQGNFFRFAPRVLINEQDLNATHSVQPGSHIHYTYYFSGKQDALHVFNQWLLPQLQPDQKIINAHDSRPDIANALDKAQDYLQLASILILIISAAAIALATQRYHERHRSHTALLRCLGCSQHELFSLFVMQFCLLGILTSFIGTAVGALLQQFMSPFLSQYLSTDLASPSLLSFGSGFILGLSLLLSCALPPLLHLKHVSALSIFRHELGPLPTTAWLSYALALTLIASLLWQSSHNLALTALLLGIGLLCTLIFAALLWLLLTQLHHLLPKLSLTYRLGLQHLTQHPALTIGQLLAFTSLLITLNLSISLRNDLLTEWQQQLPAHAANHFAMNIFPTQLPVYEAWLHNAELIGNTVYPIVRGRLIAINNQPLTSLAPKNSLEENAKHRELSLTWSHDLPDDNLLSAGAWWSAQDAAGLVSVEQKLAANLDIKLGDMLTFSVTQQRFTARVSSVRKLNWNNMKPNFYMLFSPGTLNAFPSTYLTSFYLAEHQETHLTSLIKQLPNVNLIDIDQLLKQIKTILDALSYIVNFILCFAWFAAICLFLAALSVRLRTRQYETALLRVFGADRRLLKRVQTIEFACLGALSGILAIAVSNLLLSLLYRYTFTIDYHPNWFLCIITPCFSVVFTTVLGNISLHRLLNKPPLQTLREE